MDIYRAFVLTNDSSYKLLEINLLMPEDTAFTSSKSDVHPCRYEQDIDPTAKYGQTDRQMDRFSAYIVDSYIAIGNCDIGYR